MTDLVDVDTTDGWISVDEFDTRGAGCHLLISPLNRQWNMGPIKDQVRLVMRLSEKKVIIPSHVDPFFEFEEIAFYYWISKV